MGQEPEEIRGLGRVHGVLWAHRTQGASGDRGAAGTHHFEFLEGRISYFAPPPVAGWLGLRVHRSSRWFRAANTGRDGREGVQQLEGQRLDELGACMGSWRRQSPAPWPSHRTENVHRWGTLHLALLAQSHRPPGNAGERRGHLLGFGEIRGPHATLLSQARRRPCLRGSLHAIGGAFRRRRLAGGCDMDAPGERGPYGRAPPRSQHGQWLGGRARRGAMASRGTFSHCRQELWALFVVVPRCRAGRQTLGLLRRRLPRRCGAAEARAVAWCRAYRRGWLAPWRPR
mmetsp:Transcript_41933/g.115655  ORF Transcript_41933/g.115655 Transcript_41933/m.115655 type:complete len:286 (-) Transcript_41933:468-1325(-)